MEKESKLINSDLDEKLLDKLMGESIVASIAPVEHSTLTLVVDDEEIITFKKDGMYYKGRLVVIDKEIEDAFRDFLTKAGRL